MSTHHEAMGTASANSITNEVGTFVANRVLLADAGNLEQDDQSAQIKPPFHVLLCQR